MPCGRSEGRSRWLWLCPPRYGNCTSEANLRVLRFNFPERHKRRSSLVLLFTAIIFLQNGLGGSPFIFLSSRSGSSDINPDCRRMQSLSRPKKPAVPLPARLRNVRLITLIPSRGVPNLGGGRERNGRNRPERGLICGGEIQFRRLLPSRSLSLSRRILPI